MLILFYNKNNPKQLTSNEGNVNYSWNSDDCDDAALPDSILILIICILIVFVLGIKIYLCFCKYNSDFKTQNKPLVEK